MRKGVTAVQTPTPNESQRIEIMAGGMGVGASRDSFHFAYLALAGDGEILATIPMNGLVTGGDAMARQAGIMFRESLDPDAAMVYVAVVGDGMGGKIVYRTVKGQMASVFPADNAMPPLSAAVRTNNWLRVRRQGNKVRVFAGSRVAATSDAGEIGTGVTLALANPNAPGYFGLAAASKDAMTSLQVRYSGAMVENVFANPATAAYVVHDLGTIGASAIWGANKLKLTGLGQPWGSVAGMYREFFAFAGQPAMGNRELAVRVDSQGNTDPEARAGIVYRLGAITSWSRSGSGASISVTPGKGVQFHQRVLMAGLTTDQTKEWMLSASKEGVRAPVWLRLVRELVPPPPTDPFGSVQTRLTGFYSELDTAGGPRAWTMLGAPVILPASEVVPNGLGVFVNSNNPAAFATAELAWPGAPPPADAGALPDAAAVDVLPAAPDAVSGN